MEEGHVQLLRPQRREEAGEEEGEKKERKEDLGSEVSKRRFGACLTSEGKEVSRNRLNKDEMSTEQRLKRAC